MSNSTQILVSTARIRVSNHPTTMICPGIGASIGLVAMDEVAGVTGLVHMMLPKVLNKSSLDKPGRYVSTGVAELVRKMQEQGALASRLVIAYVGGAEVFTFGAERNQEFNIGTRNVAAVSDQLHELGLRTLAADLGGNNGRTLIVESASGEVRVRTTNGREKTLCILKRTQLEAA